MSRSERRRWRDPLYLVRTVLPVAVIVAGTVILLVRRDETGLDAFTMLLGAGLSIWLLNFLYRVSVTGERDRDDEDRAREYLDRHGHWPDEQPAPQERPDAPPRQQPGPDAPPRRHPRPGRPHRPGGRAVPRRRP